MREELKAEEIEMINVVTFGRKVKVTDNLVKKENDSKLLEIIRKLFDNQ